MSWPFCQQDSEKAYFFRCLSWCAEFEIKENEEHASRVSSWFLHFKLSYAIKEVVEVDSVGMTACDLNENLDCLDDIHQGKFNIIYASAEAAMDN